MFLPCGHANCYLLFSKLCSLLHVSFISRQILLPFGTNWFPTILSDCFDCGQDQERLRVLEKLRSSTSEGLVLLLCALVTGNGGKIVLPDADTCRAILEILSIHRIATCLCEHSRSLHQLPATVIGRIARSTSCTLSPFFCVSIALQVATSAPSALLLPGLNSSCGHLYGDGLACSAVSSTRLVGITSLPLALTPVCELFWKDHSIFICIQDSPVAARTAPLCLSEIKAALARFGRRRILKKWLFPLSDPTSSVRFLDQSPVTDFARVRLFSSFMDGKYAHEWEKCSLEMTKWMAGPMSIKSWKQTQTEAFSSLLALLRHSKSPQVQRVLDTAAGIPQDMLKDGYWVYALVSPLWGKCYVGNSEFRNWIQASAVPIGAVH